MKMKLLNSIFIKLMASAPAAPGGFASSNIATGTQNLLNDVLSWLFLIIPVIGAVIVAYLCIRRASADEQDKKQYTNRIVTAIISTVIGLIANSVISLVVGYFQ